MASFHSNQNGDTVEQLIPPEPDDSFEVDACAEYFGEPDIVPRVGDEFQVEIPPISGDLNHYQLNLLAGLPIPCFSQKQKMPSTYANKKERLPDENESMISPFLPGLCSEQWTDAEKSSFLLGLYIFQKNFVEVKRFVETKDMGAILSFYYGEFYGSQKYCRWSDGQRRKSKKCVYGQRMFSGLRQQELISRVLPTVSADHRDHLLEVFKRYNDEKMSLAEFVFSLKATIGMNVLVNAVGIGTGKRDLTGMALEPLKSSQVAPTRPEIPTGKACSTLTPSEIIKFISGDYRLSKGRANDIFWEAVWPRLLARGWHSEQPRDQGYIAGFNNCLVFLVPSVKKFSRRKLVKGDHYFDSVTDVLNKVAKEPGLLELEDDNAEKNQDISTRKTKFEDDDDDDDDDDLPSRPRHSYLQPRAPKRSTDMVAFTFIDTSLPRGKVRELRELPVETLNSLAYKVQAEDSLEDAPEETDECETTKSVENGKLGKETLPDTSNVKVISLKSEKDLHKSKHLKKVPKALPSKKLKRDNADNLAATSKRCRKSTTSNREEMGGGTVQSWPAPRLENGMSSCSSSVRENNENLSSRASSYQDKMSSTSSSKGSPSETVEYSFYSNLSSCGPSLGTETQIEIDLNVPQISPEMEEALVTAGESKEQENQHPKLDGDHLGAIPQQQTFVDRPRRQRPLTIRAMEALADGYLTVNRQRKTKKRSSRDEPTSSRPLQRARGVAAGPTESVDSIVGSQTEEAENVSNDNVSTNFQVLPEENKDSDLRQ